MLCLHKFLSSWSIKFIWSKDNLFVPSSYSEGTSGTSSRLLMNEVPGRTSAWCQTELLWGHFLSCNFFTKPYRFELNERQNTRISRVQAPNPPLEATGQKNKTKQKRQDLTAADIVSKVVGLEKQARKTSNAVFRDDERKNEQGLNATLLNIPKTSSTKNAKLRTKGKKDKVSRKPATSSSERTWAKTSKAWTRDHCSHIWNTLL